jgi:hypothetical protein
MERIQIISILISVLLAVMILHLIATRRLRIQYSVIWLATSAVLIVFSLWRDMLHKFANLVGIYYPPSLLFLTGFLFSLLIILHFSILTSRLFEMTKQLAQKLGILEFELKQLQKNRDK